MVRIPSKLLVALLVFSTSKAEVKKDIEYGGADHIPLLLDAYILDSPGSFPAVIYVHGGGFTGEDKKGVPKPRDSRPRSASTGSLPTVRGQASSDDSWLLLSHLGGGKV